jgi:tRNA G18 (ribose-2'-O)-methylase SpoU
MAESYAFAREPVNDEFFVRRVRVALMRDIKDMFDEELPSHLATLAVPERLSVDDVRLHPFTEGMRQAVAGVEATHDRFWISEGMVLSETLGAGDVEFESVLLTEARFESLRANPGSIRSRHWLICSAAVLERVAGFKFHGGMMGLGMVPKSMSLVDLLLNATSRSQGVVVCVGLKSQDNLGLVIRTAKALGWAGVVTTPDAGSPWSRRVLRQSMGSSLLMPVVQTSDLAHVFSATRSHGMTLIGAALNPSSLSPEQIDRSLGQRRGPVALVLGNEHMGLTPAHIDQCDQIVKIPMVPGHDSLNVAVAAGILMWHWSPLRSH